MAVDLKSLKDEELVKIFKDGNERAFDELYNRYAPRLKKLIYYRLGDADESNDVLHDVFLRVYKHINSFKTDLAFSSWIYRIAVNCSKNYWKKSVRNDAIFEMEMEGFEDKVKGLSPEEILIQKTDMAEFYKAVNSLKEKFKTVFLLRFDEKLQYSDIAVMVKCSERTAKWRMQKAIEKIVDYLRDRNII
jgi:RNA polymerase sigma-70 factor, ECF subfamily